MLERQALEAGHSTTQNYAALLTDWWHAFDFNKHTAGAVVERSKGNEQLREVLLQACGNVRDEVTSRTLGRYLKRYVGRVMLCEVWDGNVRYFRLQAAQGRGRMVAYYLEDVNP